MNKVLLTVIVSLLLFGGIYFGMNQFKNYQQSQSSMQQYNNSQQGMSQIASPNTEMTADDPNILAQETADDQSLNQISADDYTEDSSLSDSSGI